MKFIVTIELQDEYVSRLIKETPIMYKYIHQLIKNSINMALINQGKVLEIHRLKAEGEINGRQRKRK